MLTYVTKNTILLLFHQSMITQMDSEVTHCETQHDRLDAMFCTRNRVSTTYTPLEAWVRLHMV